jgi:hypothetical protein
MYLTKIWNQMKLYTWQTTFIKANGTAVERADPPAGGEG